MNRFLSNARPVAFAPLAALLASCYGGARVAEMPSADPIGLELYFARPGENPMTSDRIELGRRLFFDPLLSRDESVSCASCHRSEFAFADTVAQSPGVEQRRPHRNTPSLLNARYRTALAWDGRFESLEEQVLEPIRSPLEMDLAVDLLIERLEEREFYRDRFREVFNSPPTADAVAQAIAAYLRTLVSAGSAADRYNQGDLVALTAEARTGFGLFMGKARCGTCHSGPNFSDGEFHNTGGTVRSEDAGRFGITSLPRDLGAFLTPSLRNVSRTPPYMHDGGLTTLEDVIDFYDQGGLKNENLSPRMRPLALSSEEKLALIAFLRELTGIDGESAGPEVK